MCAQTRFRLWLTAVAFTLALSAGVAQGPPQDAASDREPALVRDRVVERTISSNTSDAHRLNVAPGMFVRLSILQERLRLRATLRASDDSVIAIAQTPLVAGDPFELAFVSPRDDSYVLELSVLDKIPASGSYRLTIADERPSRPGDDERIALERALADGERLFDESSASSRSTAKEH